jgi:periplasmic protein TonB
MSTSGAYLVSVAVHASLAAALGVLPLLSEEALPAQAERVILCGPFFEAPLPPPPGNRTGSSHPALVPSIQPPAPRPLDAASATDEVPEPDTAGSDEASAQGDHGCIGDSSGIDGSIGSVIDASSAPPQLPAVVRISSGLTAPRVVRRVEPVYPALALAAHATATVVLEAQVDPQGNVTHVAVTHGHPLFDAAAIEAVGRWRYQPLLLNGVPTAFILTVTVQFGLRS